MINQYMSHEQNPGWLDCIGDDTTQLYRDYNNPLEGSLLTNQYNGKYYFFFSWLTWELLAIDPFQVGFFQRSKLMDGIAGWCG